MLIKFFKAIFRCYILYLTMIDRTIHRTNASTSIIVPRFSGCQSFYILQYNCNLNDGDKGVENKSFIQIFGLTITDNQVKTGIVSYCQPIVERLLTLGFLR